MRILVGNKWREGFLDYYRSPQEYRLQTLAWQTLEKIEEAYHTRPKKLRLLLNYFPIVGPGGMFRKTWSRLREEYRNEKYTSCGVGKILEAPKNGIFKKDEIVGFIAPLHPMLIERLVLPELLIFKINSSILPQLTPNAILYLNPQDYPFEKNDWWKDIRGWSIHSGIQISNGQIKKMAAGLEKTIKNADWEKAQNFPMEEKGEIKETKGEYPQKTFRQKTAVLFGYGNYPKINNIPYSKPYVLIKTIHEIDPTEIVWEKGVERWDASPLPRPDEQHEVYFIASYNHTHVPLAVYALNQGAYVMMEKPIATDYQQLEELKKAIEKNGEKLFIGFQKRYSKFNDYAFKDLGVSPGEPIDYHCVVFEIIQPKFFWYNWPNSRSRLFANGCHQIDHFLYLNNFSEPKIIDLTAPSEGRINVWIELKNGAFFTMTFSEMGSSRVGPRDHIELKIPGKNIRITDAVSYVSEDENKIIRRKRVWKTEAYKRMYKTIAKKIADDEKGDSLHSIMVSAKTMIALENKFQALLKKKKF